jgi:hypothetical protein
MSAIAAKQHESYGALTILAILMPLIGLVLGVVYLTKDKAVDRKLGEHLVAISVLFFIIWGAAYTFLIGAQQNTIQQNYNNAINQALRQ